MRNYLNHFTHLTSRWSVLFLIMLLAIITALPVAVFADPVPADIQKNIDAKSAEIQALQAEITQYQNQVNQIQVQANNLQTTLSVIGKDQKRLQTNLVLTSKKAEKTTLTIKQNEQQIGTLGQGISKNTTALAETIRSLNQNDNQSLVELLASDKTVSGFMKDVDQLLLVQSSLKTHVTSMQSAKAGLERAQQTLLEKKNELDSLKSQFADQKKIVDSQANQKKALLSETKSKESEYQKLLDDRKKQVEALNAEIFSYESQLKFTLNTKSLPKQGALAWPLADVLVTQRFGKTMDAKRLYVSGSHSGVDFRASVGTAVYAAADGVVEGTGDTDKTCYKASFGKWVFIRHNNGLATAYGHLSLIKATEGQQVKTGDLIGYSGSTGHATGPHLHLTVYASNGVNGEEGARVASRPSLSCKGKTFRMPVAPTSAYLDPLLYLPHAPASLFKDGNADAGE